MPKYHHLSPAQKEWPESENIEEYLETIYRLEEKGGKATTTTIANELQVSAPSVSEMMKKLAGQGYLKHEPYGEVALTPKGRKLGRAILRKHRLLERFLRTLGLASKNVHNEACRLEHSLSPEVEAALKKRMAGELVLLSAMRPGQKGEVASLEMGRQAKRRLEELGLTPGTAISLLRTAPFGGPVEICVRGSSLAIGRGMAQKLYVKVNE